MPEVSPADRANDPHDLNRFVQAQEEDYAQALTEIRSGRKTSHWKSPRFDGHVLK